MDKKWYLSKTLWVNGLAILASFLPQNTLSPEVQLQILGVINLILRVITKQPVAW